VFIQLYIKLQHHQPEIAHRTWQPTLTNTSALFILEDVLQLTKGRAIALVSFNYFRASMQAHRKDSKMKKITKEVSEYL
jgi:hypothetical protein